MISLGDFRCQVRRFAFLATFLGIIYHPCMVGICWLMLTSHISRRLKSACIQYWLQLWPAGCCTGVEVYNRTLCDVRVAARNPEGERSLSSSQISDWVINKKWRQKRLGVWCETLGDLCLLSLEHEMIRAKFANFRFHKSFEFAAFFKIYFYHIYQDWLLSILSYSCRGWGCCLRAGLASSIFGQFQATIHWPGTCLSGTEHTFVNIWYLWWLSPFRRWVESRLLSAPEDIPLWIHVGGATDVLRKHSYWDLPRWPWQSLTVKQQSISTERAWLGGKLFEHVFKHILTQKACCSTIAIGVVSSVRYVQHHLTGTGRITLVRSISWFWCSSASDFRYLLTFASWCILMPRMICQGWAMQEPVAVELATSSTESPAVGTSSRWVLEMEAVEGMTWPCLASVSNASCHGEIHEVWCDAW